MDSVSMVGGDVQHAASTFMFPVLEGPGDDEENDDSEVTFSFTEATALNLAKIAAHERQVGEAAPKLQSDTRSLGSLAYTQTTAHEPPIERTTAEASVSTHEFMTADASVQTEYVWSFK